MKKEGLRPNGSSYREVVDACGKLGKWQKAVELVQMMRSEGVEPHIITYNTAIHGCVKSRQVEKAMEFFQDLLKNFDTADIAQRRVKVSALVKTGDFRSAVAMYYEMHHAGLLRLTPGSQGAPLQRTQTSPSFSPTFAKEPRDNSRFKTMPCRFFTEGKCMKGKNCTYMHAAPSAGAASDGDDDETCAPGSASEAGDSTCASSPYSASEAPSSPSRNRMGGMVRPAKTVR